MSNLYAKTACAIFVATLTLSSCSSPSIFGEDCPEVLASAALTVTEVVSAEFECGGTINDQGVDGTIVLDVENQEEANGVIEKIYRALAANPDVVDTIPNIRFVPEQGDGSFRDTDLGFNGSPSIGDMREKYGITPSPTS
ncbi:hypothetical protein ACQEVI_27275 [Promicromonospora sp. CA-289599]|uniref:hypothetical protein n=1 Tax=Promicromonospora sp. CA-289599 TaxID=3240014 RepID=UPI003D8DA93C